MYKCFHEAGYDTIVKIAESKPEEIREKLKQFIEETNFDGSVATPSEIRFAVSLARYLPKLVEYE